MAARYHGGGHRILLLGYAHRRPIEVAVDASREKVEKMFLQILGK
jgi:hypothetical protein